MADQNKDRDVGRSEARERTRNREQDNREIKQPQQEQVKGGSTAESPQKPKRYPGQLPLPD